MAGLHATPAAFASLLGVYRSAIGGAQPESYGYGSMALGG